MPTSATPAPSAATAGPTGSDRPRTDPPEEVFRSLIVRHLVSTMARPANSATPRDWWIATALAVRDHIHNRMIQTQAVHNANNVRRVYYLSLEYLMGRLFESNLLASGLDEIARGALKSLGVDFDAVRESEVDMGLGNGGLGRLAACFLDSMATLDYPALGYGIHYEFGLFKQAFSQGNQIEHPDRWMLFGDPWEVVRAEFTQEVRLYGRVENVFNDRGQYRPRWVDTKTVLGVPHDIPIAGFGTKTVNLLRLWASRATDDFDLAAFNSGGYVEAVREKAVGETISKVLYPNDKTENGKELRLVQQYFFVACSIQDIIRRHFRSPGNNWGNFADKVAMQLNDTHPAVAVAELMRILIDEAQMEWDPAWQIVVRTFGYTNHTLLPEALERWGVPLFERLLPRHLQILYLINQEFLLKVAAMYPGDQERQRRMSVITDEGGRRIRMAHLAIIASHRVNGVAQLHSDLMRKYVFSDFAQMYPDRFINVTNGIAVRRWLKQSNIGLAALLTERLGVGWENDLEELGRLIGAAEDPEFLRQLRAIKRANKQHLADEVMRRTGVEISVDSLFDIQVKRIHEYKRQLLNLLYVVTRYRRILDHPQADIVPRTVIFAGKAAPGYAMAKAIVKLINNVARTIDSDPLVREKLRVAFLPDYDVSLAQKIMPAADLSQQISTAGMEASGTGNMKLALNGALTIGTLDGANIEIRDHVGAENIFIFGLNAAEVAATRAAGYRPRRELEANPELKSTLELIGSGFFSPSRPDEPKPVIDRLLSDGEPFLVLADFAAYDRAQEQVDALYRQPQEWSHKAAINCLSMGYFSSDRSIREYAERIWGVKPVI